MPSGLTILLTNIWLDNRAGSEIVTRDLAIGFRRRGHRPIVYSPSLGAVAEDLKARGIVTIDDLRSLAEPPDIIHAHHLIPCGEALYRFSNTPAVYTCHAFAHWAEAPAHFPQIAAYIAVDEACRDRLVHAEAIDPSRVVVIPNGVDLIRFPERSTSLPKRPRRVVAFGKAAAASAPRIACERLGIPFETIGTPDAQTSRPEGELINADLVFASARCALESMCCGCAVVVADPRGMAGFVTLANYHDWRSKNFGLRALVEPLTVEACIREINRYDPLEARQVSELARRDADLEQQLDKIESLHQEVLHGLRRPTITPEAHDRAMARFLHEHLPRRPADIRWPWLALRDELNRKAEHLEAQLNVVSERAAATESQLHASNMQLSAREAELTASQSRFAALEAEFATAAESTRSEVADLSQKLAILRKSRLLKLGRVLRRLAGRPVAPD